MTKLLTVWLTMLTAFVVYWGVTAERAPARGGGAQVASTSGEHVEVAEHSAPSATGVAKDEALNEDLLEELRRLEERIAEQEVTIADLRTAAQVNEGRLGRLEENVEVFEPYAAAPGEFEAALDELELDFESNLEAGEMPEGWARCGPPGPHEVTADDSQSYTGRWSTRITNSDPEAEGFGGLLGRFPHKFVAGKRVRYSGYIRTEDVQGAASLWFRADGGGGAFNNMMLKPEDIVAGDNEWSQFSFELDIPEEVTNINFGAFLSGSGTMWVDDLDVEIVDEVGG